MTEAPRRILITGAAGFVGFHLARRCLARGMEVVGVDSLNDYYDPALKKARLAELGGLAGFRAEILDIADHDRTRALVEAVRPTEIVHLAAQAGVRYSLLNPRAYLSANVDGFLSVLEACRHVPVSHLVYASSSSVYGTNTKVPFSEDDPVDHPASLYGATKRSNELMAETYGHLFGIRSTGLRFFTVYGPWGRPDMAYYAFTQAIFEGREVEVFNEGRMSRDFTYVDDVVEAITRLLPCFPTPTDGTAPHAIYNIGTHTPVALEAFIDTIAEAVGKPARKVYRPMQPGDVVATFADVRRLSQVVGFAPSTPIAVGIPRFVEWYRTYHQLA